MHYAYDALSMSVVAKGRPIASIAFCACFCRPSRKIAKAGNATTDFALLTRSAMTATLWQASLPAGLYFRFHLIEGETLTPMLLARRFTLNPVIVIISLVFWFWMWGIPGGILSMPVLAITKIICDRLQPLAAFGHFLEG
jgi:hypothetical protein